MKAKFGWVKVNDVKYEKDIVIHQNGTRQPKTYPKRSFVPSELSV